jgi:two-component system, response regulator
MSQPLLLVVEDDPNDEELMLRALRKRVEATVVVMRDGAAALEYLFPDGKAPAGIVQPPTAIFLDLNLPKIGGLEVLRRIRAHEETSHLPVVVLSSSAQDSDLIACYRLGANSYVVKPVDSGQFAETVQQMGNYWLRLNHPTPS